MNLESALNCLRSGTLAEKCAAADWLGVQRPASPRVIDALIAALHDVEVEFASDAMSAMISASMSAGDALVRIGEPAIASILGATQDGDANVAMHAIVLLRDLGPVAQVALPALRERLRDASATARDVTAEAIASISSNQPDEVVPDLIAALADRDVHVVDSAALALGRLGTAARVAVPALEKVEGMPRERARLAIKRITGDS